MKNKLPIIFALAILISHISNPTFAQYRDDARISVIFKKSSVSEKSIMNAVSSDYGSKYDQLWHECYTLYELDKYVRGEVNNVKKSSINGEEANSDDFSSSGISIENSVTVYPTHSSNGQFTLKIDNVSNATICQLEVFNMMGDKQEVYLMDLKLGSGIKEFDLNLNGYDSGAYFVKFKIGEAILTKKIFIIE